MTTPAVPLIFGGLAAWIIYRRVRRNIGRQKLQPVRVIIRLVILSLVSLLILGMSFVAPGLLASVGGGLLGGIILGFVGLRLTRFETTAEGHFYTPNTSIGVALSLLLVGRMLYRFWVLDHTSPAAAQSQPFHSPPTFFIFGLIAGYSIVYYIGLFVHTHDKPVPTA